MNLIEEFIQCLETERRYSPLTVRNYRRDLEDFTSWLGVTADDFRPENIERSDIEDWAEYLFEVRGNRAVSVNRAVATLRSFWRWMLGCGHAKRDIIRGLERFKSAKRLPVFVSSVRMEDVVESLRLDVESDDFERVRDAVIVLLIYTAGLRLAELVSANAEDVASDFSSIRVMGKGRKERVQPLLGSLSGLMKRYFGLISSQNICTGQKKALILSKKGERINQRTVERIVERILHASGVQGKSSPHVLRHTFATHLLNEGADLREIQELLGHSSLRATEVYTHTNIEQLKRAFHAAHPREREE